MMDFYDYIGHHQFQDSQYSDVSYTIIIHRANELVEELKRHLFDERIEELE